MPALPRQQVAEPDSRLLTLRECAEVLGVPERALRRDVERGMQAAQPGGRGRGRAARFDLDEVRAWRADPIASVTRRAARIPALIADAAESICLQARGDRGFLGPYIAALATMIILAIEDELLDVLPNLPVTETLPPKIATLRGDFRGQFAKVGKTRR